MYPIEIEEVDCRSSFLDIIKDVINFIVTGIRSFSHPSSLLIFLKKSFHF